MSEFRNASEPLDIAIAGTRGVPASYSGFETFAEELGKRLVKRGHRVTVYGRVPYVGSERREYLGMQVVPVSSPRGKHLETPLHTLASAVVALRASHDVVLVCNGANAFTLPLFRLGGARVAINVDGLDRTRRKWGMIGKLWFFAGERLALALSNRAVTDAQFLQDYYWDRYRMTTDLIPYGGDRTLTANATAAAEVLQRFGLQSKGYVLIVGRLVPENNGLLAVQAHERVRANVPLVVLGDAPYAHEYKARLHAAAGSRVIFTGAIYGDDYLTLQANAACYIAAGEVSGAHPALVEAMCMGGPIVANDVPEHREVLGETALFYSPQNESELAAAVDRVLADPELGEGLRAGAKDRAAERYQWRGVVSRYEQLFYAMKAEANA